MTEVVPHSASRREQEHYSTSFYLQITWVDLANKVYWYGHVCTACWLEGVPGWFLPVLVPGTWYRDSTWYEVPGTWQTSQQITGIGTSTGTAPSSLRAPLLCMYCYTTRYYYYIFDEILPKQYFSVGLWQCSTPDRTILSGTPPLLDRGENMVQRKAKILPSSTWPSCVCVEQKF